MAPPVPTRAALGALLLLLAAVGAAAADAADSLSQCAARGFQPGDLACSTCTKMERVLRPLDSEDARGVVADCRACCSPVLDAVSPVRYAKAELKLCRFSLSQHGGVNEFLEKSGYNDVVDVTDVMGHVPTLILRQPVGGSGDDGDAATVEPPLRVVVASWKTEQIDAFLTAKTTLVPAPKEEGR